MPPLDNIRHERFAQELAKGTNAAEAYTIAGYVANDGNCIRLKGDERISRRVDELLGKAAHRAVVSIESLIEEAADIQKKATDAGQFAAATAAMTAKAKLANLWIERAQTENTNVNYAVGDEPPTDSEWESEHVTSH